MYCQKPASPIKPLQLACTVILSLGFLASAARRADAEPPSELSALRVLLPESGFIECALWNPDDGAYEAYGYDLGTGAWYERRFGVTRARLSDGTMYWPEGEQGAKFLGRPDRSLCLERRVMPFIWLREITKHPEAVHSVTAASDGTREIVFEAPYGDPALVGADSDAFGWPPWRYRLVVGPDGRLIRADRLDAGSSEEIRYLGEAAPGVPIGTIAPGRWELLEAHIKPGLSATRTRLTPDVVDEMTERMIKLERRARSRAGQSASQAEMTRPDPASRAPGTAPIGGPVVRDGVAFMAGPLILTGGLAIGFGIFLWWRRRG